jgi:hypothetical protein
MIGLPALVTATPLNPRVFHQLIAVSSTHPTLKKLANAGNAV